MRQLTCPSCGKIFFRSEDERRAVIKCPACAHLLTFGTTGGAKSIKQEKYAREDPKYIRTYFAEMQQHNVDFRTRMQWLSRIYGGRNGYSSEELYKIVTGKTTNHYYIFPFVKNAPPEVNRILERVYRRHRKAGDSKTAAAVAAWTKVKQAGYVKVTKPTPSWVKKGNYEMKQLQPMQVLYAAGSRRLGKPRTEKERRKRHKKLYPATKLPPRGTGLVDSDAAGPRRLGKPLTEKERLARHRKLHPGEPLPPRGTGLASYGIGAAMGGLTERGIRGMGRLAKRHPGVLKAGGAFGFGYLTHKELEKRKRKRKRRGLKPMYQLNVRHFTPDIPVPIGTRVRKLAVKPVKATSRTIGAAKAGAMTALVALLAMKAIDAFTSKTKSTLGPYLPEVRTDIEVLPGYAAAFEQVACYAGTIPTPVLQTLKQKGVGVLRKVRRGTERGMLLWLMGFISAELLSRGFTTPKRKQEIVLPQLMQQHSYARIAETGERLPRGGFQPYRPGQSATAGMEAMPTWKKKRRLSRKSKGVALAVPLAALIALRARRKRQQKGYAKDWGSQLRTTPKDVAAETVKRARRLGGEFKRGLKHPKAVGAVGVTGKAARKVSRLTGIKVATVPPATRIGALARKHPGVIAGTVLGLAALRELRKLRKQRVKQGYSFRSATGRVLRGAKKTGGVVGKGLGRASNVLLPALIISELWPKKKRKLPSPPPVQSQRFSQVEQVQLYPMKSEAQRRWMHATHPKMAEEWERKTPLGKKLPERKRKKKKKYALGVPLLLKHARNLLRLRKSRVLGRDILSWGQQNASRMQTLADAAGSGEKVVVRGIAVPAKTWFLRQSRNWEAVTDQVSDMVARGQLEKLGVVAAAIGAGAAARELGKKSERERIRRVVG